MAPLPLRDRRGIAGGRRRGDPPVTEGRSGRGPIALMAARHLETFGVSGLHLKKSETYDPASGAVAGAGDRFERRIAQADLYRAADFPAPEDGTVFLMAGEPPPEAGDGLIGLTRYWRIEKVAVVRPGGGDGLYAAFCV